MAVKDRRCVVDGQLVALADSTMGMHQVFLRQRY